MLRSGSNSAPAWTTATYPGTVNINQILYASSNNVVTGLNSAASSVLTTNGSSIPSFSTTLPASLIIPQPRIDDIFDIGTNAKVMEFSNSGTTGNFITTVAGSTTQAVGFQYHGVDANVTVRHTTNGSGPHEFYNNLAGLGSLLFRISGPVPNVNFLEVVAGATGTSPLISAIGGDPSVSMGLLSKSGIFVFRDSTGTNGANIQWYNAAVSHFTGLKVAAAQATDLTLTLPAVDGSANFIMKTDGAGTLSFGNGSQIAGTTSNTNATAGNIGEFVSSVIPFASSVNPSATNVSKDITSISLTAGDWDVWGNFSGTPTGTTTTLRGWISSTSATLPDQSLFVIIQTTGGNNAAVVPQLRFSLSGTTTIFLSSQCTFTTGSVNLCGGIYARRVR